MTFPEPIWILILQYIPRYKKDWLSIRLVSKQLLEFHIGIISILDINAYQLPWCAQQEDSKYLEKILKDIKIIPSIFHNHALLEACKHNRETNALMIINHQEFQHTIYNQIMLEIIKNDLSKIFELILQFGLFSHIKEKDGKRYPLLDLIIKYGSCKCLVLTRPHIIVTKTNKIHARNIIIELIKNDKNDILDRLRKTKMIGGISHQKLMRTSLFIHPKIFIKYLFRYFKYGKYNCEYFNYAQSLVVMICSTITLTCLIPYCIYSFLY
jgi:hypothetical protein